MMSFSVIYNWFWLKPPALEVFANSDIVQQIRCTSWVAVEAVEVLRSADLHAV